MSVNSELVLEFAIPENLDRIRRPAYKSVSTQQFRSHRLPRGKHIEFLEIHHRVRNSKQIVKPALRYAPVQRHLPAFKSSTPRITAPGLLSLVAGARRLAEFRADPAAHAHLA